MTICSNLLHYTTGWLVCMFEICDYLILSSQEPSST